MRLRFALHPTSPSGIRWAHQTPPGRPLEAVQSAPGPKISMSQTSFSSAIGNATPAMRSTIVLKSILLHHRADDPNGLASRPGPHQAVGDERRGPVIAVGPHDALGASQAGAHGDELDGDGHPELVHSPGRHAFDVAGQEDAAIGLVNRQVANQVIPLFHIGLVLAVGRGSGHVPVHGQLRAGGILLRRHDIDQAHHIAVTGTRHQHRAIGGGLSAHHHRRTSTSPWRRRPDRAQQASSRNRTCFVRRGW